MLRKICNNKNIANNATYRLPLLSLCKDKVSVCYTNNIGVG